MVVEAWKHGADVRMLELQLTPRQDQIHQIIVEATKKVGGIKGDKILDHLMEAHNVLIEMGTLTGTHIKRLKELRGIESGSKGYYDPSYLK